MPSEDPITVLTEADCWELLAGETLGRLATSPAGKPEIFPVNYAVQDHTVLFRSAEGTKLMSTVINDEVAFEADGHGDTGGWSVVLKGHARLLEGAAEIAEAEQAPLRPWVATLKLRFVRIVPTEISGRRFVFGPEPDRFG
ncbi:pyridoxamine 5'-phosphate oxidase family protein [Mycobacterium sp. Y57]|uniref:pyridoxamine 5'-phosphate oxidase family protein n=1 Tax=Mycolicibacterium xanthum TaxID=2796469 RepID=UPI001C840CD1|nr:pyridoxamine 5'-phosphate oxidase family protein [Mycolicibacterium xanthum]MBX7434008.1 pyridoxamine 5'-phosphate oxidase family protein [Mycolicibacterium xanthum]